jgi:putative DNA primase/helicase
VAVAGRGRIMSGLDAAIIGKGLRGRYTPATGQWSACCPAHDDATPSLTVKDGDGKVLIRCHAGCSQREVISALEPRGRPGKSADR